MRGSRKGQSSRSREMRVCGKVGPRSQKEPASPEDLNEVHGLPELRKLFSRDPISFLRGVTGGSQY